MNNNAIKYLLGPILLLQGMWVRKVTPVLPEPPGEREGVVGQGPTLRLLILGDSAAAGVGVKHQNQALLGQLLRQLQAHYSVHFKLIARSSVTTRSTFKHLAKIKPTKIDVVVTSLGVNDVTSGVASRTWIKQQQKLRGELKHRFGDPYLIITSIPPMHKFPALPQPLRWYLGRVAKQFNIELNNSIKGEPMVASLEIDTGIGNNVKTASDGFHPGASAYTLWGESVATAIIETIKLRQE